ncbi:cytochrome ubiquinol oxidase subunit I [Edaphobacter modestus]|uniref:Cytochrome d ubiquinol oxidase subunit I n=1 Tax=Edaphobacter modestus TaxID=388466 RepID=A0A4Q7YRD6_9BACT|nr:cytochrome ubiquinol oxidase subunit I [Edaphobacter modestus]RZU40352.1 cytochrome d ubiquinol oxidase subunit I [Edaphobacter modestus]
MSDLFAARSQMAISLAFHIIFAVIGVALPLMMVIAEARWLRTRDAAYLCLAKRWAKGTAILFAIGAVSGTVLSLELGLLWPHFMGLAGAAIGMPFSLEGFAFFTEAIFLGIYLYGWNRVSPAVHLLAGSIVAVSGVASAMFVCLVNGWMNTPVGFRLVNGQFIDINVWKALNNPAGLPEAIHMILAAYCAAGFATAGIHALLALRDRSNRFHRHAIAIALLVGGSAAVLQAVSGDALARVTAVNQPTKLAAMEGDFVTRSGAPLRIGGLPDVRTRQTKYAIEIPYGLSILAFHSPKSTVDGLDKTPRNEWPNVLVVHIAFQIMVGIGTLLMGVSLLAAWLARKRRLTDNYRFLQLLVLCSPLGFVALEAGWTVTEVGRQPWIIYHILRTSEAVTTMPGLTTPLVLFTCLYLVLAVIVIWLMTSHVIASPTEKEIQSVAGNEVLHAHA